MLNDKIDQYWGILNNLSGLIKFSSSWGMMGISMLIAVGAFYFGLVGLISFLQYILTYERQNKNTEELENTTNESEEGEEKQDFTDKLMNLPHISVPLGLIFLALFWLVFAYGGGKAKEYRENVVSIKEDIILGVFEDYVNTYDGVVLKPKEMVRPSAIHSNTIYKTSFMVDGDQYNEQIIYVMYTDKFEKDTLIPFDATKYGSLIPTEEQRVDYYVDDIYSEKDTGFRIDYKNISGRGYGQKYLDEIDYIYNINILVEDKE